MTWPPPPPSEDPARPPVPWITPTLAMYSPGYRHDPATTHRMLLAEMATALLVLGGYRAGGIAFARSALRAAGWSWQELLNAPVAGYLELRRSYGHPDIPSPTALDRAGASPPCGQTPDGAWMPGWGIVCARAIAERVAWASVPLLVEASLLAAVDSPSSQQVERLDTLMHAVWREPDATGPMED